MFERMDPCDWRRSHIPRELEYMGDAGDTDYDIYSPVSLFFEEREIRRTVIYQGRKRKVFVDDNCASELSTDHISPGVLKIFGETIVPGVEYKSVLASYRSTAQELVKQALDRYDVHQEKHEYYILCDVVGIVNTSSEDNDKNFTKVSKWQTKCCRILSDQDRPLLLQNFWRPADGLSRRYELRRRSDFSDCIEGDDTSGLNENARKISISKLRPGAIPYQSHRNRLDKYSDDLNINTNIKSQSWVSKKLECNKVINSLDLDVNITSNGLHSPKVQQRQKLPELPPSSVLQRPFLLTVRGYDVRKDSLCHTICAKDVLICNNKTSTSDSQRIVLHAPDIQPRHCYLHLKRISNPADRHSYNFTVEVEGTPTSLVCVNGYSVTTRTTMHPGDILYIGKYYIFLFKDYSQGYDIPLQLPWLGTDDLSDESLKQQCSSCSNSQNLSLVLPKNVVPPLSLSQDDNMSISTMESTGERFRFAYSREKEEDLMKAIGTIVRQNLVGFPLAPAYLYSMCIEYSCKRFDLRHIRNLLLRILGVVRDSVGEISKSLSEQKFNCGLVRNKRNSSVSEDYLKYTIRWMANCVQLILFLRKHNFKLPFVGKKSTDDDPQSAFQNLATGLEEIVIYCFQQAIYAITKALYGLLSSVLDDNPFSENDPVNRRSGMAKITAVFDSVLRLTTTQQLHQDVLKQIILYLFFFCNTSLFNKLFQEDSGPVYYNWSAGVRIRTNIGQIEDWAQRNGFEEEFTQVSEKLLTAAEFLSTSKSLLVKFDWMKLKTHFQPLNEAQLYHLVCRYDHGGKPPPTSWLPSPEDRHQANMKDEITLEMTAHPPFLIPQENGCIDLNHPPDDAAFWKIFKDLHPVYGICEDDSDSGFSPSGTPRFTGNFPKIELQNSFFNTPVGHKCEISPICGDSIPNGETVPLRENNCLPKTQYYQLSYESETSHTPKASTPSSSKHPPSSRQESINRRLDLLITNNNLNVPENFQNEGITPIEEIVPPLPPRSYKCSSSSTLSSPASPRHLTNGSLSHSANSAILQAQLHANVDNEDPLGRENLAQVNRQIYQSLGQMSPTSNRPSMVPVLGTTVKSANNPVFSVGITKGDKGLGLGLIDGLYTPLRLAGIYIRKVLPGSPAAENGKIQVGDRLLCVNGKSIVGADYQSAMKLIRAAGDQLTLLVAKGNDSVATKISSSSC